MQKGLKDTADQAKEDFKALASIFSDDKDDSLTGSIVKTEEKLTNLGETSTGVWAAMKAGANSYVASMKSVA